MRRAFALVALFLFYAALVSVHARRPLWFDELFTYDLASAPTVGATLDRAVHFDLNPPLGYLVTRWSFDLFGKSAFAARLPSMIAFLIGSVLMALYTYRKAGRAYALLTLIVLWGCPMAYYAAEARPYAWLFAFFALTLLCWDITIHSEKRTASLWGVGIANLGMFASHVFAPFSLAPFLAAEAVRFWQRRKADPALWAALLLPMLSMLAYVPLFKLYGHVIYPTVVQAGPRKVAAFIYHLFNIPVSVFLLMASAALIVPGRKQSKLELPTIALFSVLMLAPIALNVLLMRDHGAFWNRYGITTALGFYVAVVLLMAWRLNFQQRPASIAAIALIAVELVFGVALPLSRPTPPLSANALASIKPDLPLVVANGLTYFEMNHYASPQLIARSYYLMDRPSAIHYAHATLFEDIGRLDKLKCCFTIPGNVEGYYTFLQHHEAFLLFGRKDFPEVWLFRKLADDGATISLVGSYDTPYVDHDLYLVTMPASRYNQDNSLPVKSHQP